MVRGIPKEELQAIAADYLSGLMQMELAQKYPAHSEEKIRRHMIKAGVPMRPRGQPHGKYLPSGGRVIDKTGYVLIKVPPGSHPHSNYQGYVREHRLVMERMLGRYLKPSEVVHHKDGDKQNNDPSNLALYSSHSEHFSDEMRRNDYSKGKRKSQRAGGKRGQHYWDKERVIEAIALFDQSLDRRVRRADFVPPDMPSYTVANRLFGRWSKAVWLAVGYDPLENYPLATSPLERGIDVSQSPQMSARQTA